VVLVVPADWVAKAKAELVEPHRLTKVGAVVAGGVRRQDSVAAGLEALPPEVNLVVVHDGVRPFVTAEMVAAVVEAAKDVGAAVTAVPVTDTVKKVDGGVVVETLRRERLVCVQTPQAFSRSLLAEALGRAETDGVAGTDEAALVERLGHPVRVVSGSPYNLKITTPEDWALAEALLRAKGSLEQGSLPA
jgi:2-C-methyl-D-erythritol 4-phosphate cytidylyltransferase